MHQNNNFCYILCYAAAFVSVLSGSFSQLQNVDFPLKDTNAINFYSTYDGNRIEDELR